MTSLVQRLEIAHMDKTVWGELNKRDQAGKAAAKPLPYYEQGGDVYVASTAESSVPTKLMVVINMPFTY